MTRFVIRLSAFEGQMSPKPGARIAAERQSRMEFHICRDVREQHGLEHTLFSLRGNVVLVNFRQVRELTLKLNAKVNPAQPERFIRAGQLNAMGLIDEILHYMVALYRQQVQPNMFEIALQRLEFRYGKEKTDTLVRSFCELFPPQQVYAGQITIDEYLNSIDDGERCRSLVLEEMLLLGLANLNPAFKPFQFLFDEQELAEKTIYTDALTELRTYFAELPPFGPDGMNLWDLLRSPALASPDSLFGQLEYMRTRWGLLIGKFIVRLLMGLDVIKEEDKPGFFGPGPSQVYTYGHLDPEYERFSPDQEWMPRTVLLAKSTLVWLFQLSQKYGREITRLDHIPNEELDELARRGFTGLWLIGLWERSNASKLIKQWTGNPEAAASAYSLYDYDIAHELGGWEALIHLRERCSQRGIHLGSDMVPNHTGIDSRWVIEHPDRFLQLSYPPFPTYNYNCGNLSGQDDITVQIEEHYFTRSDAAVVFKRLDNRTGEIRYIYHGNDGTSMPWNDTAQIDFLNPEAREAVIRTIIGVCKQFSIVRFDAAMTLAKRHIQRLWYPEPGRGGDIASRAEHALSTEEFNQRIPNEFWREVVDRCAAEAPNTLLLAEAFWMMEGYFVRTLGMHRVYNSAFMNMLKNEENAKYRATIKNTLEFDPEVLKRFVNFLNNPDEETAVAQFGKGDKYFGICTLLVTMPGLPMFGHGQIEGFEEKYGMEYSRSYKDEKPDQFFVDRHEREIFPLMKRRMLFSGSADFCLYDFYTSEGSVNEHVFAYSNRLGQDRSLVMYNNSYYQTSGWIRIGAVNIPQKNGTFRKDTLAQALLLHHEDRYFVLFREQRSDLWYIRSSKDIHEHGLFVLLNGYEAQVFLDIHEVEDTQNHWAHLCAELDGRGVRDIYASLQDLLLGELYAPFMELFKPERIEGLYRIFADNSLDSEGTACLRALREPVMAFIATALKYVRGAEGRYAPFDMADAAWEPSPIQAETICEEFMVYLYRFLKLPGASGTTVTVEAGDSWEDISQRLGSRYLYLLGNTIKAKTHIIAFVVGYGVLAMLRSSIGTGASGVDALRLINHWQLDRKLRDVYQSLGISCDEAYRVTELIKSVLARTAPLDAKPYQDIHLHPENLILENYNTEDFRRLLGVNFFEDTIWFNKEAFEDAFFYVPLFLVLESDAALEAVKRTAKTKKGKASKVKTASGESGALPKITFNEEKWFDRMRTIGFVMDMFHRAETVSEYKLDLLLEALSKKNKVKTENKKPSQKKGEDV